MSFEVLAGDCIEVMRTLEAASIDAVVCDPPYGLEFMGKDWDRLTAAPRGRTADSPVSAPTIEPRDDSPQHRAAVRQPSYLLRCETCGGNSSGAWGRCACETPDFRERSDLKRAMQDWHEAWAREAFRVLKPGGHLLAFGGTRTYHRLAAGIEDAGFEIRDSLSWMYGSGFPKSLDVSKAIDKAQGVEGTWRREDHPGRPGTRTRDTAIIGQANHGTNEANPEGLRHIYEAGSDEAKAWQGWGTALKPAYEPIVMARKPLAGTVAANVLEHGTGALNIDGCRIEFTSEADEDESKTKNRHGDFGTEHGGNAVYGDYTRDELRENYDPPGRWPANVVMDEEAGALLDEDANAALIDRIGDYGGASRFFYCSKTSTAERNAGLDAMPLQTKPTWSSGEANPGTFQAEGTAKEARNVHPTVKPIDLMRWLVRLVTPPGGTVLDPFAGSGSTGCAAVLEGFEFIGIEKDEGYLPLAEARIRWWAEHPEGAETEKIIAAGKKRAEVEASQMGLFG